MDCNSLSDRDIEAIEAIDASPGSLERENSGIESCPRKIVNWIKKNMPEEREAHNAFFELIEKNSDKE